MALILCIVLLLGTRSWGDDEVPPGFLVHPQPPPPLLPPEEPEAPQLRLVIPFGQRLVFSWSPFVGSGPFHFDNVTSSPYYARDQDVEFGVRLGFDIAISNRLHLGVQLPYVYNPSPLASVGAGQLAYAGNGPLSMMNDLNHLDLAIGITWSF